MLNIEDFVQRMQILMDYYNISASAFADRLTVQRSSLSHLMSGRNKPSLDFIMRITEAYPDADLYWLLYGKGEFPKSSLQSQPGESFQPQPQFSAATANAVMENEPYLFSGEEEQPGLQSQSQFSEPQQLKTEAATENLNEIERIVVFYKNGTFKNYNPGQ
jgi:transcriptional regulator with XRE-family HTH domain